MTVTRIMELEREVGRRNHEVRLYRDALTRICAALEVDSAWSADRLLDAIGEAIEAAAFMQPAAPKVAA